MRLAILMVLLLLPKLSVAGTGSFDCKVVSVHSVTAEGTLLTEAEHLKGQIGSTFSVERSSGEIRGGQFINNRASEAIRVVNEPVDNSYYVISTSHGPAKSISYLYIANYRKWLQKPFTYTGSGEYIYSGYCTSSIK